MAGSESGSRDRGSLGTFGSDIVGGITEDMVFSAYDRCLATTDPVG
jgi:hypothetical protein